jgi:hypothetical protein
MTVGVVVPTKSNFAGLQLLLSQLVRDPAVAAIVVVADGEAAADGVAAVLAALEAAAVTVLQVPLGAGIHVMWNAGLEALQDLGYHVAFVNDDVTLADGCLSTMARLLDDRPEIGLATPAWDDLAVDEFVATTGFAGFCMVLARDLVREWRFDERMKWWYGDNEVICWVDRVKRRQVGICGSARCYGNRSHTINTDPPADFQADIANDARLFAEKWES